MTPEDLETLIQDGADQLRNYNSHEGQPKPIRLYFEWQDGSGYATTANDIEHAWQIARRLDRQSEQIGIEIISAWRDEEPWFGQCTDFREGTP